MRAAVVLYEDSGTAANRFDLHTLVVRCLHDDLASRTSQGDLPELHALLRAFEAMPCNGSAKVVSWCQEKFEALRASNRSVVAVYDQDKLRRMVNERLRPSPLLTVDAPCEVYGRALRTGCPTPGALHVVRLEQNTESVLTAMQTLGLLPGRDDRFARAIRRKELNTRDELFRELAREGLRPQRARLRESMPSFDRLVRALRHAYDAAPART